MSLRDRIRTAIAGAPPSPVDLRTDSSSTDGYSNQSNYSGSAMSNPLSGLGGYRDSGAQARPNTEREYLTTDELVALLRGGLYRRICQLHPSWATTKPWIITDDTKSEHPLHAEMKTLNVRATFRRADTWGRGLGECMVLMVTDDPAPLSEPLDPTKVKRLHRLEIFDRREFWPLRYNADLSTGTLGAPTHYSIQPRRAMATVNGKKWQLDNVHASRLLRFYGDDLPPSELPFAGSDYSAAWGADAVGQTIWDACRNLSQTGSAGARVAQELSIAVFKVAPPRASGDESASWISRIRTLNMMKSVANAVLLSPGEEFQRIAANPSGYRDISDHAKMELALVLGAPMTLLFGEAPGGLNTDGSSWQALWYQSVGDWWEDRYRPQLERLLPVLYHSTIGTIPDEWGVSFPPLGDLSERERADIRLVHTQADAAAILDGVLTPDEIRRMRYGQQGGYQIDLQPVEDIPERPAPQGDPEAEAAAQRMVEEALAGRSDAYPDDFRAKEYKVPAGAKGNAEKVLAWRDKHGSAVEGMTATGWRRARQLAGGTVKGQDVIEMAAWFARHEGNETVAPEHEDEPWKDAGLVAWLGWGGDTAKTWAEGIVGANRE